MLLHPTSMHNDVSRTGVGKPFMQHGSLVMSTRRGVLRHRGPLGSQRRRALSPLKPVTRRLRLLMIRALTTASLLFQIRTPRGKLPHPGTGLFGPPVSLVATLVKPATALSGHGGSLSPPRPTQDC